MTKADHKDDNRREKIERFFIPLPHDPARQEIVTWVARAQGAQCAIPNPWGVTIWSAEETLQDILREAGLMVTQFEVLRLQALRDLFEASDYEVPRQITSDLISAEAQAERGFRETFTVERRDGA